MRCIVFKYISSGGTEDYSIKQVDNSDLFNESKRNTALECESYMHNEKEKQPHFDIGSAIL